ncbi:tetratricopeptide repeat protein [Acanthopleuribacter pedis]|uniref:Uncharacterized protein n=1 Tax=Acanthopleuribacter pedis TaxID=442870 RepID=A0A8J7QHJ6_9BACT|nr:HrpB1 family type III secretion system apparatus protein [Acanthopleuribacter pedis]MBO1322590.1 hypothetical protein [Acanthopleuribacter pedis]
MEIPQQSVQDLMEVGYLAGGYGYFKDAIAIFEGLSAVRPDSEYPHIGLAMTHLGMKQTEDAVRILRDNALPKNPENPLTKAFLGLALMQAGLNGESESVLNQVIDDNQNETAVELARNLLAGT